MTTELTKAAQQALEALEYMHKEKCDYMIRNKLGDPLREDAARLAIPAMDALRRALTQRPAAQTEDDVFMPRRLAATQKLTQLGYHYDSMQGQWLPAPQQATPEPLTLGPLAKRNIYDAIRGAYDLGYNDARNARTVPGDSAPGYDGRSVEEDHGGALFNTLNRRLAATPEPVGEVVAWMHTSGIVHVRHSGWPSQTVNAYTTENGWSPLYTRPAPGVPEGFSLVPVEPTQEMLDALNSSVSLPNCYRAMLAAAQAKGADPEDLAAAGVMLMGRRADHD